MKVIIRLRSTSRKSYERAFEISDTPRECLAVVEAEHYDAVKYQNDRVTRIGYALATEYSAKTSEAWYFSGWHLPERQIRSWIAAAGEKTSYWVLVPVWDLESCLADSYYREQLGSDSRMD